ncbi:alanine racemase domain-containing protein (plasmid) [Rhizobium gallicum bv. gallicum R602sp]|uniref:alanine racemase n=1 Tax=Rhizobium gallicum bv. gallicum R602sp TaxID=1041138 RepID=A0A0B4XB64_9HYPH|nr:alanine racemase domain-containing protein [Rhizobium gallicum bv. gallicum R602sp]TDW16230.1 alanine racemase [Rhizobium azibense]
MEGASGYLTIDLSALGRNYEKLSRTVSPSHVAAVVKADAYGLGADQVARTVYAGGCRHFFIAQFVEAKKLRPALPQDAQIFVLNGLQPGNEDICASENIVPVINSIAQWRFRRQVRLDGGTGQRTEVANIKNKEPLECHRGRTGARDREDLYL